MTAGKGDKRRPSQISRQEENLRWGLATGEIAYDAFIAAMVMGGLGDKVIQKGVCRDCKKGMLCGSDYGIVCKRDSSERKHLDSCIYFEEDR